jgi:putative addiction module killer protein
MMEICRTDRFINWLDVLSDLRAVAKIAAQVEPMASGNFDDVQPFGAGASDLRIHDGPRYRVYFVRRGSVVVILLCGGDKSSRAKDIRSARAMAQEV